MDIWSAAATLFLLLDPLGNIPVFHSLLEKHPAGMRRRFTYERIAKRRVSRGISPVDTTPC